MSDRTTTAALRTSRVVAVICAVGSFVFVAVMSPTIVAQFSMFAAWWLALAGIVFLGFPIVAITFAALDRPHLARTLLRIWAPLIPLTVLLMPLALVFGSIPESLASPWVLHATLVAGAVSAAAWPDARGFILTALTAATVVIGRIGARADDILVIAILDGFAALATGSVIATLITATIRASASLDAVADDLREQSVAIATADTMTDERTRIVGDVHDGVLAVLLGAARAQGRAHGRAQGRAMGSIAADATRILARADAVHRPTDDVGAADLVRRLHAGIRALDPAIEVDTTGDSTAVRLPVEVADAIVDAAAEAVRNSVEHAGGSDDVRRSARVVVADGGVAVHLIDDGVGFDPAAVDPRRLGISTSILGRMSAVEGGSASVSSQPGRGTAVVVRWQPPRLHGATPPPTPRAAPRATQSSDLSRQLGFGTPGAVAILVLVVATQTALALWLVASHPIETMAALALIAFAGALVVARGRFPMGPLRTGLAVSTPAVAAGFGLAAVDPNAAGGYAGWVIGAAFTVLLGACLQGRPGWASAGGAGVVLVVLAWQAFGGSVAAVPGFVVREVALFAMGAIFTFQFRRTARLLAELTERRTEAAVDLARAEARAEARRLEFDPLIDAARPWLQRIAGSAPLTAEDRAALARLEARLRDRMRAPVLAGEAVAAAVDEARTAGIDVVLIDDTGLDALSASQNAAIARSIVAAVPREGSLVVRATTDDAGIRLSLATDLAVEIVRIDEEPVVPAGHDHAG